MGGPTPKLPYLTVWLSEPDTEIRLAIFFQIGCKKRNYPVYYMLNGASENAESRKGLCLTV